MKTGTHFGTRTAADLARKKGTRGPITKLTLLILAFVILMGIAACGGSAHQSDTASSAENAEQSGSSAIGQEVSGWWQTLGQSGSVCHHFVGGADYVYMRDQSDSTKFTFYAKDGVVSVEQFAKGYYPEIDDSGIVVTLHGGATYFMKDSTPDTLESRNSDGSGYSASSSLVKMSSVPAELEALAGKTEA